MVKKRTTKVQLLQVAACYWMVFFVHVHLTLQGLCVHTNRANDPVLYVVFIMRGDLDNWSAWWLLVLVTLAVL